VVCVGKPGTNSSFINFYHIVQTLSNQNRAEKAAYNAAFIRTGPDIEEKYLTGEYASETLRTKKYLSRDLDTVTAVFFCAVKGLVGCGKKQVVNGMRVLQFGNADTYGKAYLDVVKENLYL